MTGSVQQLIPKYSRSGKMLTKLAFGAEAASRVYRLRLARYKALAETVAAFVNGCPDESRRIDLLDIGQGSGRSLAFIEREGVADRVNFYGIDASEQRIASIYRADRWRLARVDVTQGLPFVSESFDICLCEQVLEHLSATAGVIEETARVLRPGGLAIFGVPIFPPGIAHLRGAAVRWMDRHMGIQRPHLQTLTKRSFARQFTATGQFEVLDARGFRIVSGGSMLAPLEDREWWYRLNRRLGRLAPSLCTEIQLVLRKRS